MVCLGNICRSPIAEGVLRQKVKESGLDWVVDSAGTESYHIGEQPHRDSVEVCLLHDIDISAQRARKFVMQDFEDFDKIYALAGDVYTEIKKIGGPGAPIDKVDLLMNEAEPGLNRSVPDPYYGSKEKFITAYKMINTACDQIIARYK